MINFKVIYHSLLLLLSVSILCCKTTNRIEVTRASYHTDWAKWALNKIKYKEAYLYIDATYQYRNNKLKQSITWPGSEGALVFKWRDTKHFIEEYPEDALYRYADIYLDSPNVYFQGHTYLIERIKGDSTFAKMRDSNAYVVVFGKIPPKPKNAKE